MPALGSISLPQPVMPAFMEASFDAVEAFCVKPSHLLLALAQVKLRLERLRLLLPVAISKISFSPSGVPQASTNMLSILAQLLV